MKFSLFVHMERIEPGTSHAQLFDELTELVLMAVIKIRDVYGYTSFGLLIT
jgi:hypothetical protein